MHQCSTTEPLGKIARLAFLTEHVGKTTTVAQDNGDISRTQTRDNGDISLFSREEKISFFKECIFAKFNRKN